MQSVVLVLHLVVFFSLVTFNSEARTRAPKSENEHSLLYWRYLCENQFQVENLNSAHSKNEQIELKCPSQNWKVISDGDLVREVVEDAKK